MVEASLSIGIGGGGESGLEPDSKANSHCVCTYYCARRSKEVSSERHLVSKFFVGRKVFRCFQPVNEEGEREEFDASTVHDVATVVEKWYTEDPTNLEECNLRWRWALGKFWLQEED